MEILGNTKKTKDAKVLGVEVWSREEIQMRLARLKEEKVDKDKRGETRLGDGLLPAGSPLPGVNAVHSPSLSKKAADKEGRKPTRSKLVGRRRT